MDRRAAHPGDHLSARRDSSPLHEFDEEIRFTGQSPIMPLHHTVIVPVNGITKATAGALVYATTISDDVRAVYVEVDPLDTPTHARANGSVGHRRRARDLSRRRTVGAAAARGIRRQPAAYAPGELVTIVVPEIVPHRWWEHLLHNKTALYIRTAFLFRPNVW